MRKLLSASFARLWKSKIFWTLEGFCFGFGVFAYALVAYNTHNLGPGWLEYEAHNYFYLLQIFIAVMIALFACFFIGTDYSDGTLRNKLSVGRSREEIYLSFLLTTFAAAFFFAAAYLLAVLLVGLPLSGTGVLTHVQAQPWRLLCCGLAMMEYAALFTMASMLDSDKARNIVISLLLAVILIFAGMWAYGKLSAPEYIQIVVSQSDGGIVLTDGAPNPDYLTGSIRTVFTWLTAILPTGGLGASLDKNLAFDWRNPACAGALTALLTILGIGIFKRKDIK